MKKVNTVKIDDTSFECPCYSIKEHYMETPQGDQFMHKIVHYPDTVSVLPITKEGKIVLIKEYRAATGDYIWSCPAGRIEEGEFSAKAALRELEEETGYYCAGTKLVKLGNFYTSPGYSTEKNTMFIAKDCRLLEKGERKHFPDDNEYLEIKEFTWFELGTMFSNGSLKGMKTAMLLNWYKVILKQQKLEQCINDLETM